MHTATMRSVLLGIGFVIAFSFSSWALSAPANDVQQQDQLTSSDHQHVLLDKQITLQLREVSLHEALSQIAEKGNLQLSYREGLLAHYPPVSVQLQNVSLADALDKVLAGTKIVYETVDQKYLVLKRGVRPEPGLPPVTITGTVVDGQTGEPMPAVNVYIDGTKIGTSTDEDGRFQFRVSEDFLQGQQTRAVTLTASFLGYEEASQQIVLQEGETLNVDFELSPEVMGLDEVIVTGVLGPTEKQNLPFSVDQVSAEELDKVSHTSVESAIRGKVAGAHFSQSDGQPGTSPSIQLRGATTINYSESPLYIVDGVILDGVPTIDINPDNIESVEVVKGAAAASLYGARAARGVINITTKSGRNLEEGDTRITYKAEYGYNDFRRIGDMGGSQHHRYLVNENNEYIRPDGSVIEDPYQTPGDGPVLDTTSYVQGVSFMVNDYPRYFDQFDRVSRSGLERQHSLSIARNMGGFNFFASFNALKEPGVLKHHEGFERNTARVNFDMDLSEQIQISGNAQYTTSYQDQSGIPFPWQSMHYFRPDIDLLAPSDTTFQRYRAQPDVNTNRENPLYSAFYQETFSERESIIAGISARFEPFDFLSFEGDLNINRSLDEGTQRIPTDYHSPFLLDILYGGGYVNYDETQTEAWNGSFNVTFLNHFIDDNLRFEVQGRYLRDHQDIYSATNIGGNQLDIANHYRLSNVTNYSNLFDTQRITKSESVYFIGNFIYDDRFILDGVVRHEGSSRFGPEEEWATYYRGSFAWRMTNEPWWPFDAFTQFKPRYSLGTGGGRPREGDKYERFRFLPNGEFTKTSLANPFLTSEYALEHDIGLEIGLWNRLYIEGTYAHTDVDDVILDVPLPMSSGYDGQDQNVGAMHSNSLEISVQGQAIQQRDLSVSFNLMFDRYRQRVTELNREPFTRSRGLIDTGIPYQNLYGAKWITDPGELAPQFTDSDGNMLLSQSEYADYFQVNDDGYLVAVGQGNSWQDGIEEQLWGTTVEVTDESGNVVATYPWGQPIMYVDEEGETEQVIGDVTPDFNLSFSSNIRWKQFNLYFLLDAHVGSDKYNWLRQREYNNESGHKDMDQTGKPQEQWKPYSYYDQLYASNTMNTHFVEENTTLTFRELSLRYTIGRNTLESWTGGAVQSIRLGVTATDLFKFSTYSGFNTDVSTLESYGYPFYTSYSGSIEIEF